MRGRLAHLIRQFSAMPYESAQRFLDAEAAGLVDELVPRARLSQVEGERDALAAGVERAHHFLDEWRSAKQGSTEELHLVNNAYNAVSEAKVSAAPILRMRELGLRNALDAERAARQAAEARAEECGEAYGRDTVSLAIERNEAIERAEAAEARLREVETAVRTALRGLILAPDRPAPTIDVIGVLYAALAAPSLPKKEPA
jgi:hypothetical protein